MQSMTYRGTQNISFAQLTPEAPTAYLAVQFTPSEMQANLKSYFQQFKEFKCTRMRIYWTPAMNVSTDSSKLPMMMMLPVPDQQFEQGNPQASSITNPADCLHKGGKRFDASRPYGMTIVPKTLNLVTANVFAGSGSANTSFMKPIWRATGNPNNLNSDVFGAIGLYGFYSGGATDYCGQLEISVTLKLRGRAFNVTGAPSEIRNRPVTFIGRDEDGNFVEKERGESLIDV